MTGTGRLILSGAMSGAENMALDEALLESNPAGPILRIYEWKRPTLSLGYFQKAAEVADLDYCAREGVEIVKRPTGGGAILHHLEFTYSLVLPLAHPLLACTLSESYLTLTRPLLDLVRGLGVEAAFRGEQGPDVHAANCFAGQACPDMVYAGRKLFGSAQRRKQGAMLLHGSLLLGLDKALWKGVFSDNLGESFVCLEEILQKPVRASKIAGPLAMAYEALLGQALVLDKGTGA